MTTKLPEYIDPLKLARQTVRLQGVYGLDQMARTHDRLSHYQGEVVFDWVFDCDAQNNYRIHGNLNTIVALQCQRCLQIVDYPISAQVRLIILENQQPDDHLPDGYEALILQEMPVSLARLVEDELILALPIIALHEQCPQNEHQLSAEAQQIMQQKLAASNPFHVLAALKKKH